MNKRWTEKDLSKFENQSGRKPQVPLQGETRLMPPKQKKYHNEPVVIDGFRFDSKLEGNRYSELKLLRQAGHIQYFLRQVPFHLPGDIVYRADFYIVWGNGVRGIEKITVEDAHGANTRVKTNKLKQVKELYGVEVKLVRAAGKRTGC